MFAIERSDVGERPATPLTCHGAHATVVSNVTVELPRIDIGQQPPAFSTTPSICAESSVSATS